MGEKPLALIVTKEDMSVSEKDLLAHIRGFIEKGMISKQIVLLKFKFVEAIDKTSVGKINKKVLREKHA